MKVLVSGGGTAGHVTPTLAVIAELQKLDPKVQVVFVAQKGDDSVEVVKKRAKRVNIQYIRAGKLRRYHTYSRIKQLLNAPMMLKNVRDFGLLGVGTLQSWRIIGKEKPDVVFIKGGYVGLPVGIAAKRRGVPVVTHDSDVLPGLTNRIISRWAKFSAVTMPVELYDYDADRVVQTGQPVMAEFYDVAHAPKQALRRELGLPSNNPVLLIVPGSSGSKTVNEAILAIASELLSKLPLTIVHITGAKNHDEVTDAYKQANVDTSRVIVRSFVHNLHEYTRAADVVVTRAGSMMIELGAQKCAVISIPSPYLTGGHQLLNGDMYAKAKAALVIQEDALVADPSILTKSITKLLDDRNQRQAIGDALHAFYNPKAAKAIAQLLIKAAAKDNGS